MRWLIIDANSIKETPINVGLICTQYMYIIYLYAYFYIMGLQNLLCVIDDNIMYCIIQMHNWLQYSM